jgi:hypothetical protein
MPRWRVDLIGKHLRHIGTVDAPTEREAIDAAIKIFQVEPALRTKLIATKVRE